MGLIDSLEQVTEAKWYKVMMPKLYGWGAAVVILGALFKIEHLPGASYMLMAGLGMEAIIFFFSQPFIIMKFITFEIIPLELFIFSPMILSD